MHILAILLIIFGFIDLYTAFKGNTLELPKEVINLPSDEHTIRTLFIACNGTKSIVEIICGAFILFML